MMPINARMMSQGSRSVSRAHAAKSWGSWTKVMSHPTAAVAMITSMTTPVATPAAITASTKRRHVMSR